MTACDSVSYISCLEWVESLMLARKGGFESGSTLICVSDLIQHLVLISDASASFVD